MLNNLTNFFNLITSRKIKSVPEGTDLIPLATRDKRYSGNYQPTGITVDDFIASIPIPPAGVQSVTGLNTNNADPLNPVVQISVNGTTVTGTGRPDSPLAAPYQAPSVDGITITGTGAPGNPLIAAGGAVTYSNVFFVDPVNGNDATGAVNRFDKPYLTYNAASTAALALAPTISTPALVVLRKGTYTDNMLLRPYVYVNCDEGVVFTFGGFYDDTNTVFCRVYGKACFYVNGRPLNQTFGSNIYLEFDRADMEMTTPLSTIFSSSATATATLTVVCNSIDTNGANALVVSLRYGVNAIIYIREYIQGPRRPINTVFMSGTIKVFCPKIISTNRTPFNPANPQNKVCIYQQGATATGLLEVYGDLYNLSDNFTYLPGTAGQACLFSIQCATGARTRVYGNIYGNETYGIYTVFASGTDGMFYDVKGNISSKSVPVFLFGNTNKVKVEGEVNKLLNDAIAMPCIYATNSCEVYVKNTALTNYNTVASSILALDSTAKAYLYNCTAFNTAAGDVFLNNTSVGSLGCVNVKSNVAIGAALATGVFTPQDYTQVTGLVLPNF